MENNGYIEFLKSKQIFSMLVAAILSERVTDIFNTFLDKLLFPLIKTDINNDGVNDITSIKNITIDIHNKKIEIGHLLVSVVKFIIVMYILYLLYKLLLKNNLIS